MDISPSVIIAISIPGVSFVISCFVASGVTSLGAKPVPPVVKITSQSFLLSSIITFFIVSISSGTITRQALLSGYASCIRLSSFGPLLSCVLSFEQVSLTKYKKFTLC